MTVWLLPLKGVTGNKADERKMNNSRPLKILSTSSRYSFSKHGPEMKHIVKCTHVCTVIFFEVEVSCKSC